jgi:hypothetical protein
VERVEVFSLDPKKVDDFALVGASCDGDKFAVALNRKKKWWIRYGDYETPKFAGFTWRAVHPQSGRLMCIGVAKDGYWIVADTVVIKSFSALEDSVTLNADGSRFMIPGLRTKKILGDPMGTRSAVVLDGTVREYDAITAGNPPVPYFSANGQRCGYSIRDGKNKHIVIDGEKGPAYDLTGTGPVFSNDGRRVAYAGYRNDTAYAVIDGKEHGGWTGIEDIAFSEDGTRYAYVAKRNYDYFLVTEVEELGPFKHVWNPSFSPDGSRFSFLVHEDSLVHAMVDSVKSPGYADVGPVLFSPDNRRFAYQVWILGGTSNPQQAVVIDGSLDKVYHYVYANTIQFSPDSRVCSYLAEIDTLRVVAVMEATEGPEYRNAGRPTFTTDGAHVAYPAEISPTERCMVVDGVAGERYFGVFAPIFSKDGRHLAYYAQTGDRMQLVVDGKAFEGFVRLYPPRPCFKDDGTITVIGMSLNSIYRLKVAVE